MHLSEKIAVRYKPRYRTVAIASVLSCMACLAGCRPDIPLIPFIKSDRMPYAEMQDASATLTPLDRSHQAAPMHLHTGP